VNKRFLIGALLLLAAVYAVTFSLIDVISPREMTITRLHVLSSRITIHFRQTGALPRALDDLPAVPHRDSSTVDGWDHPILYSVDGDEITLSSLGRDGKVGGGGDDADRSYTFNVRTGFPTKPW
jgi:hypothetical protein